MQSNPPVRSLHKKSTAIKCSCAFLFRRNCMQLAKVSAISKILPRGFAQLQKTLLSEIISQRGLYAASITTPIFRFQMLLVCTVSDEISKKFA